MIFMGCAHLSIEVTLDKEVLADSSVSVTLENTAGDDATLTFTVNKQQMC